MAAGDVSIKNTVNGQTAHTIHNYGPVFLVRGTPLLPPWGKHERRARSRPPTEIDQRSLLQMMERLTDRSQVLDFMEREYGTRTVLELESNQLHQLRWYVEVLLRRT